MYNRYMYNYIAMFMIVSDFSLGVGANKAVGGLGVGECVNILGGE